MKNLIKRNNKQLMTMLIKALKERQDSIHKEEKIKLFLEASSKRAFLSISSQTSLFK